jgi:hypothetical protein
MRSLAELRGRRREQQLLEAGATTCGLSNGDRRSVCERAHRPNSTTAPDLDHADTRRRETMRINPAILRQRLSRLHHLPSNVVRTGRSSLVLGAILLIASTATVLAMSNTPPVVTSATLDKSIVDEGETVTLTVSFTDPDVEDLHTILVNWADIHHHQTIQLPAGQLSAQITHQHVDDDLLENHIWVTVVDRQTPPGQEPNDNYASFGTFNALVPIQVRNVAPSFVDRSITVNKKGGSQVTVEGDFVDPGTADQMTVTATWGDPQSPGATACSLSNGNRHFVCEHAYRPNLQAKTYPISLTVKDDDDGIDQHQTGVKLP